MQSAECKVQNELQASIPTLPRVEFDSLNHLFVQRACLLIGKLKCAISPEPNLKKLLRVSSADLGSPLLIADPLFLLRKEVIQPQVPLRLPCYDFIPITIHTFGTFLGATSGTNGFHDVTGGVYKAWERIHGAVADAPLLAIPTSCRRVADDNLNWARFWGICST